MRRHTKRYLLFPGLLFCLVLCHSAITALFTGAVEAVSIAFNQNWQGGVVATLSIVAVIVIAMIGNFLLLALRDVRARGLAGLIACLIVGAGSLIVVPFWLPDFAEGDPLLNAAAMSGINFAFFAFAWYLVHLIGDRIRAF